MTTLIAYRTSRRMERKAADELRRAGIRACLPRDLSADKRPPTARGYVFARAAYTTAFVKHVRRRVGCVTKDELARLYIKRPERRSGATDVPFAVGQKVWLGDIPAVVADIEGLTCIVVVTMFGKQHTRPVHYARLRPG